MCTMLCSFFVIFGASRGSLTCARIVCIFLNNLSPAFLTMRRYFNGKLAMIYHLVRPTCCVPKSGVYLRRKVLEFEKGNLRIFVR